MREAIARRPAPTGPRFETEERIGVVLACLSSAFVLLDASTAFLVLAGIGVAEILVRNAVRGYRTPAGRPRAIRPAGAAAPVVPDAAPPEGLRPRKAFWFSGLVVALFARQFLTHLTLPELALVMLSASAISAVVSSKVARAFHRLIHRDRDAPALPPGDAMTAALCGSAEPGPS